MEKVDGLRGGKPVEKIILKSGTDFRELSAISLHFHADERLQFEVRILQGHHSSGCLNRLELNTLGKT